MKVYKRVLLAGIVLVAASLALQALAITI